MLHASWHADTGSNVETDNDIYFVIQALMLWLPIITPMSARPVMPYAVSVASSKYAMYLSHYRRNKCHSSRSSNRMARALYLLNFSLNTSLQVQMKWEGRCFISLACMARPDEPAISTARFDDAFSAIIDATCFYLLRNSALMPACFGERHFIASTRRGRLHFHDGTHEASSLTHHTVRYVNARSSFSK